MGVLCDGFDDWNAFFRVDYQDCKFRLPWALCPDSPGARQCDHITPVLRQLHWLPASPSARCVQDRGARTSVACWLAPAYLADDCRLLSDVGRRPLRSNPNDMLKLLVPRTHNKLGDKSFSDDGHRLWTTAAETYLRRLQTIYEKSFIWRPKRLVTLLDV